MHQDIRCASSNPTEDGQGLQLFQNIEMKFCDTYSNPRTIKGIVLSIMVLL